jgi:hypothetical protein
MCVGHNRREVKEATMNGARMYSLERRLAKIEKERGMTGEDDTFNQILRLVGEPTYVSRMSTTPPQHSSSMTAHWH